jgi:hypothetical protein
MPYVDVRLDDDDDDDDLDDALRIPVCYIFVVVSL